MHGNFGSQTAQILTFIGAACFNAGRFSDCIKVYEEAGMVYQKIENMSATQNRKMLNPPSAMALSKVYLHLINLYFLVGKEQEAINVISIVSERVEGIEDNSSFVVMNEVGNILRKYERLDMAREAYKKAMGLMKRLSGSRYLES